MKTTSAVNYDVHIFYYVWYIDTLVDGKVLLDDIAFFHKGMVIPKSTVNGFTGITSIFQHGRKMIKRLLLKNSTSMEKVSLRMNFFELQIYPTGKHNPDNDDLGANFFPEAGPYR